MLDLGRDRPPCALMQSRSSGGAAGHGRRVELDHLDLIEAASDAAAALDADGSEIAPYLAAFGASSSTELDPADRTDLYLEVARAMADRYADVVDGVAALEAYERGAQN
jgi:hypothetical protein